VDQLGEPGAAGEVRDPGLLHMTFTGDTKDQLPVMRALIQLFSGKSLFGLKIRPGIPQTPMGPSMACRVNLVGEWPRVKAVVTVTTSGGNHTWTPAGQVEGPLPQGVSGRMQAGAFADAIAEAGLGRAVKGELIDGSPGPGEAERRGEGEGPYWIRIENDSPLILNGLILAGAGPSRKGGRPMFLVGLCIPPRKSLTIPAADDLVERLGLRRGVRILAADLSG